jgi:bacterial/archaeal transporter family-2 protein
VAVDAGPRGRATARQDHSTQRDAPSLRPARALTAPEVLMFLLLVPLAFLAGVLNTIQSGANATLNKGLGQPIVAALCVTAGNVLVYLVVGAIVGLRLPSLDKVVQVPWWAWIGGLCGSAYVLAVIFFADKLGAAVFTGCTVTAGVITSVVLDHFGLVGFKQHAAGLGRLAGCALMIGGLSLIAIF